MPTIYNPPQNMKALVMHHVTGATDEQLQKMRPLQVYLTNIDELIGQTVVQTIAGIPFYYAARIAQTGTDAPTVVELFNSIDATLAWTRSSAGVYVLAPLAGTPFAPIRTLVLISPAGEIGANTVYGADVTGGGASITLNTWDATVLDDELFINGLFVLVMVFNAVV